MFFQKSDRILAHILSWLIQTARPLFGPSNVCPLYPGCTEFALQSLKADFVLVALLKILFRVTSCNPVALFIKSKIP